MFDLFLKYILESLVQHKGRDITWIHMLNGGVNVAMSGARSTKNRLRAWKHFLTASRSGSEKVRLLYSLNVFLQFRNMIFFIILWAILSKWFFTDFNPFSYMDVNGNFWEAIITVGFPPILYAFLSGQLDWFGSSDAHEAGTVVAESLPFKWFVSLSAGVTEEIDHRGTLIFVGLISIYCTNLYAIWVIGFFLLCICIFILAKIEMPFVISGPIFLAVLMALYGLNSYIPENPIYQFHGFIFDAMQQVVMDTQLLSIIIAFTMTVFLIISASRDDSSMGFLEIFIRVLMFTAWSLYCLPLGIATIAQMPIMPAGGDHWTYLLYIGAILWSNAKFRDGHKYQGPSGMLNSYVIGIYMFHVAFTHGLLYAITIHVLFDVVIFTSEHICQVIKNRKMVSYS